MKRHILAISATLAAALVLFTGTANAGETRIEITGTQTCNYTSLGEMTFPGGNLHVRGATAVCATAISVQGGESTAYLVSNWNLDDAGAGPVWGTSRSETAEGVVAEGNWWGRVTGIGTPDFSASISAVAHGRGSWAGAHLFTTSECQAGAGGNVCTLTGYIIMH